MDVMKDPFFTVIIPTFNRKELLKGAVRSVLDQTFGNFEIIIVDDHSADGTGEIIPLFGDDRIEYVVNDHTKGISGARNAGIDRAKGTWTAFLDDDDIWLPEKLEILYMKISKVDDSIGLIYTGYSYFDFDKEKGLSSHVPAKEGWVQEDLLYRNFIGTFSTVAVRTDILRRVGGCDESYCFFEDGDLYVRISEFSKVAAVEEALTYVRTSNKDRLSFKYDKRMMGFKRFWEKHRLLIDKCPKLRHRAASRIFVYATLQGEIAEAVKVLPWTLAGIIVDMPNMLWIMRLLTNSLTKGIRGEE